MFGFLKNHIRLLIVRYLCEQILKSKTKMKINNRMTVRIATLGKTVQDSIQGVPIMSAAKTQRTAAVFYIFCLRSIRSAKNCAFIVIPERD